LAGTFLFGVWLARRIVLFRNLIWMSVQLLLTLSFKVYNKASGRLAGQKSRQRTLS